MSGDAPLSPFPVRLAVAHFGRSINGLRVRNMISIEKLSRENIGEADQYLSGREETSQFLINNLKEHGPTLTTHPNSGNFKLVRIGEEVKGVFCLARRGTLIVQTDVDFSEAILNSRLEEPMPLRGFIGEWGSTEPIWRRYQAANLSYKPSYQSKESLYSYDLRTGDENLRHDARVRFLRKSDFEQWLAFSRDYMTEHSIPDDLTSEQKQSNFMTQIKNKTWWGLFDGPKMLSRTALNTKGETVGQVGGVFTPKQLRQKGYAKATMFHMLKDCRDLHGHRKNILFTGEANTPAQKLYESMGYRQIGSFAMIVGPIATNLTRFQD